MKGNFIDTYRFKFKKINTTNWNSNTSLIETDYGKIRVFDTKGNKPVLINTPDGPNVIEHHLNLISKLSEYYRVICFEFPGIGFSYPNAKYNYTLKTGAQTIVNLMDILKIERATLAFSCSNGFYAIKAVELYPERIQQLFLSQTPSLHAMDKWTKNAIPKLLTYPIIGQVVNAFSEEKFANKWYKYALPKESNVSNYQKTAIHSLKKGGCFCLSSLVQGLKIDLHSTLKITNIPTTMIWGAKDFTHKGTNSNTILEHIPNCTVVKFNSCGHFPELENTNKYVSLIRES